MSDGERRDSAGVRFRPPFIFLAGLLLGVPLELAFPIEGPPAWIAVPVAVVGVAVWLWLDGSAMALFRRAGTSPDPMRPSKALVTRGPYHRSRNPMYVGMAFLYVGLAVVLGLIWSLLLLPFVMLAVDRFVVPREERYLESRFGEDYSAYRRRVRRWL